MQHPLSPLEDLPGISQVIAEASQNIARVHRHIANRRNWDKTGGIAALRSARASALLEITYPQLMPDNDPYLRGALRVADVLDPARGERLSKMISIFRRAPLQICAQFHILAAKDVETEINLGKPRADEELMERLHFLKDLIVNPQQGISAAILSGIIHAEIVTLAPFETMNGIVARACSRLALASFGFDPHNLGVPEQYWLKRKRDYRLAQAAYKTGSVAGIKTWLEMHILGLNYGAEIAWQIAEDTAAG